MSEELGEAPPTPPTRGAASRALTDLRCRVEQRREQAISTAREAGRRQGLVDGKNVQAADAVSEFANRRNR